MEALLPLLLLACPIGMVAMMWFMARGMRRGGRHEEHGQGGSLPELKAEQARLAEKIEALEEEREGAQEEPVEAR